MTDSITLDDLWLAFTLILLVLGLVVMALALALRNVPGANHVPAFVIGILLMLGAIVRFLVIVPAMSDGTRLLVALMTTGIAVLFAVPRFTKAVA